MRLEVPDYVVLVVEALDRALPFYCDVLGLPLGHRSGPFAQLATGATRVALYERHAMAETLGRPLRAPPEDAPGFELGFKVEDVDAAYATLLARGARPGTPPTDRPWGQRTAYVRDPDGHWIELAMAIRSQASGEGPEPEAEEEGGRRGGARTREGAGDPQGACPGGSRLSRPSSSSSSSASPEG